MHLSHLKLYLLTLGCRGLAPLSTILKERGGKQEGHGEVICLILFLTQSSRLQEIDIDTHY